jgi:hypothetical protein
MPRSSAPGDALQFGDCPLAGELVGRNRGVVAWAPR